jgi:D-3-phosphoglycerate dehydrogenase
MKVLIADKLSDVGVGWLKEQDDVNVEVNAGLPPEELAKIVGGYDGMIVRSGVKVNETVLKNAGNLKCIARAGVGVDNIDVPLATSKGIIVMNTPGGNTLATAELTMALMLGLSRKIAPANQSLKSGEWNRKAYKGVQLSGKALGVVGLGRIGQAVAKRAAAFEMRVLGFDPFFAGEPESHVELVKGLQDLCKRCDYLTVHVPKSQDTLGMIGAEQFAVMKPTAMVINAARGGIIDPDALLEAITSEKIAGAALDVYTSEPPETEAEKQLIQQPNVLAVPHLGASTEEAQEQVALEAGGQLVEALRGGSVRNALNAPGFGRALPEWLLPYTELCQRMGTILANITPGALRKVEIIYRGRVADETVAPLTTYLLVGLLSPHMEEPVNVINAPVMAQQRGAEVETVTSGKVKEFANMVEVTIHTDKMKRSAKGTIFGNRFPRVIAIDGYRMEMKPEGHVLIVFCDDQPGVVGKFGSLLGTSGINIADMTFSRKLEPKKAVVGINLDSPPTDDVLRQFEELDFVDDVYALHLPILYVPEKAGAE